MFTITANRLLELGFREISEKDLVPEDQTIYQSGIISVLIKQKICRLFIDKTMVQGVENEDQLKILCRLINYA